MKKFNRLAVLIFVVASMSFFMLSATFQNKFFYVYKYDGKFAPGYNMGVDSHKGQRDWVINNTYSMRMEYPGKPNEWGVVFFTVGESQPDYMIEKRESRSFTMFDSLKVDMRGIGKNETVYIGMKDKNDYDDGSETKIPVNLTPNWQTYSFALEEFYDLDLKNVYVPIEFVFEDDTKTTVLFRRIRFHLKN
jgi:hypothetical protein